MYPKESVNLEADYHQKIFMKFSLKDKNAKSSLLAHQTFVQFVNRERNQEVVFVAEPDSSNVYRFDLVNFMSFYNKVFGFITNILNIFHTEGVIFLMHKITEN